MPADHRMMRILIADDERCAREELRYQLQLLCRDCSIFEAADGQEAIEQARAQKPEVVFLDIQMGGTNGLEVAAYLASLDPAPCIVFATAYSEYAVAAFELAAVDYLVKPYHERRLAATLERIRHRQGDGQPVARLLKEQKFDKIWGEDPRGDRVLLNYDQIAFVEAQDKRVFAVSREGLRVKLKPTLRELEALLEARFLRVHKGYLVNLKYLARAQRWSSGGFSLQLCDGPRSQIQVSRRYAARFKEVTGLDGPPPND